MEPMLSRWILFVCLLEGCSQCALPSASAAALPRSGITSKTSKAEKISFQKEVQPLLSRYCYPCHGEKKKGDLDLRIYTDETIAARDRPVFEKVLKNLQAHEMPPENKPQPTVPERDRTTHWGSEFFFPCDCKHPDPGRVTIRRLNRAA